MSRRASTLKPRPPDLPPTHMERADSHEKYEGKAGERNAHAA